MTATKRKLAIFALTVITALCMAITFGLSKTNVVKADEPIPVTSIELDGITSDMIPQVGGDIKRLSKNELPGYVYVTANADVELNNVNWISYNVNSFEVGDKFLSGYTYGVRVTFGVQSGYKRGFDEASAYTLKGIDSSLYTVKTIVNSGTVTGVDFMFDTLGEDELAMVDESKLAIPEGYVTANVNTGYIYLKGGKYPYTFDDIKTPNWITYSYNSSRGTQLNILFEGDRPTATEGEQTFSFRITDANGKVKVFNGTIGATVENPNMIKEININYAIPSVGADRPTRAELHEIIALPDGITWNVGVDGSGVNDYAGSATWSNTAAPDFRTFKKDETYTLQLYLKTTGDKVFAGESLLKGALISGGNTYKARFGSVNTKSVVFSVEISDYGVDPDKIKIKTETLPQGKIGVLYKAEIEGSVGEKERFSATIASIGLTLSEDGTLSGTPTKAGTFNLTVSYYYNEKFREQKYFKIIIEDYTKIDVPAAKSGLKYNGGIQVGVEESAGYTLDGNKATAVGTHTATAKLAPGYCWSDNTTADKTITWAIGKGEMAAPSGLQGVKTSIEGASDGQITGVNGTMEYKAESATTYIRCTGSTINNLKAGIYSVRYKATDNYNASADTIVTVPDGNKVTHTVTVTGGVGGGTYEVGATVTLKANAAQSGFEFTGWTITGVGVADLSQTEITFVMPDCDVSAVANYKAIEYSVVVDGGTADVEKSVKGATVTITANSAPIGEAFDKWVVVSGGVTLADVTSVNTTFTMLTDNVSVKATYKKIIYNVVVTGGVALKSNSIVRIATYGEEITIRCNTLERGKAFDKWTSAGVHFADENSAETTFTMPASDVTIVANIKALESRFVSVSGGLGAGVFYVGETVTITANTAPEGKEFDKWVVVSGGVTLADENSETTTFVMPNGAVEIKATYKNKTSGGETGGGTGGEDNSGGTSAGGTSGEVAPSPATDKKGGIGGGAIAGIVVGSVAVAGLGGFAIFWFAVKKKSFAELIAAIKALFKKK